MVDQETKNKIVKGAIEMYSKSISGNSFEMNSGCLYWTLLVIKSAREYGVELIPQAGTTMWRITPEELDDGVRDLYFGYEWEDNCDSHNSVIRMNMFGQEVRSLPEIHVWAAHVEDYEIVDLTVGFQPKNCERIIGKEWLTEKPERFLWGKPKDGWLYQVSENATKFAVKEMVSEVAHIFGAMKGRR